ncbi:MAG TPA: NupC/NupG family nucleoside CNT transporter [Hellea balneolensis]|uniref:NupC/NupG family nucleoside CNT transporter n=1 Tax=Hellea balneolensis TaxID=287478 RepID=A0A7C3GLU3_9PROT|nr:NupC/NupG family nucleoside CNT transporter [Hellea balneolensis]
MNGGFMPIANILGVIIILAVAYLFSESRSSIKVKDAGRTLALQFAIALLALAIPAGTTILNKVSGAITHVITFANEGMYFVFGELSNWGSVEAAFGGATGQKGVGTILAFQVFPIIIFLATLFAILFHLRIMDMVIKFLGGIVRFVTGASRLESTVSAASIFVGMVEAPLAILPYLKKMTRSQLFTVMSCGMASIAGTVLVVYISLGVDAKLLIIASFMAAPGGLLMGKLLIPETETPFDIKDFKNVEEDPNKATNLIEAATTGALTGLEIMLNVLAVIIAFVAVIALVNGIFSGIGGWFGHDDFTLETVFGYVFAPIAWLIGVPTDEVLRAGPFLGQKLVANEFLAYLNFTKDMANFSLQGQVAITVALCGFANFVGVGILMAGLGSVVPERKKEISALGMKSLLAGSLSNFMSAALVGIVLWIAALMGLHPLT